jgi:hypothetical protein
MYGRVIGIYGYIYGRAIGPQVIGIGIGIVIDVDVDGALTPERWPPGDS